MDRMAFGFRRTFRLGRLLKRNLSIDDGVDAVTINRDPFVGGPTIVQAKRYTKVIGVR
jgi:hypothetical protein